MLPYLIAIAGPSCSGKTSVANRIAAELPSTIFALDHYYNDLGGLSYEEKSRVNFDHPDSLDSKLIIEHLRQLAAGQSVQQPTYDFATHSRTSQTELVTPREHVIVEGLFPLYWEELVPLYSTKVFMLADHDVCLPRREQRDIAERGRTRESVQQQYKDTVRPMTDAFVNPTRRHA